MKLRSSLAHFPKRIGFISTRFHGTDGVTLEAAKWADILEAEGADCFWMAGLWTSARRSATSILLLSLIILPSSMFKDTSSARRLGHSDTSDRIQEIKNGLKNSIYRFIERFDLELLIPQNILAIPMHVPRPGHDGSDCGDRNADNRAPS
jgi:hypothetical protein